MAKVWVDELWRLVGLVLGAAVVGLAAGRVALVLALALAGYLGWHLYQLYRLERWLRAGSRSEPPEGRGIWGDVFYYLHRLRQRNRRRKRRLTDLLGRFREATDAMPDAAVVLDPRGDIQWFNDAATRLLGLKGQDVGYPLSNLVRHPRFVEYLRREDYSQNVQFPSPTDDAVMLSVRIVPYGENQRLVLARDISRLHRLEQMRRDFVANASHELRTPLTVLGGYLETLADSDDAALRQWQPAIEQMRHQANRMRRLVDDLLLLSRLETDEAPAEPEAVAVPAMLASIREDAELLAGERAHAIELEAEPGLQLRGDYHELRSAFANLVLNAVQHTPAEGRIAIRWYADAGGAHLAVSDTGPGIPPQHLPRLTERFYRVDVGRSRAAGGTGLGLAIVKHVLHRHGGALAIDSRLGRGSTFQCDFPSELIVRQSAAGGRVQAE